MSEPSATRLDLPAVRIDTRHVKLGYAPPCDTGDGEMDGTIADLVHSIGFVRFDLSATSADICRDDELVEGREGDCDIAIFMILGSSPQKRDQARLANLTIGVVCVDTHSDHGRDRMIHG